MQTNQNKDAEQDCMGSQTQTTRLLEVLATVQQGYSNLRISKHATTEQDIYAYGYVRAMRSAIEERVTKEGIASSELGAQPEPVSINDLDSEYASGKPVGGSSQLYADVHAFKESSRRSCNLNHVEITHSGEPRWRERYALRVMTVIITLSVIMVLLWVTEASILNMVGYPDVLQTKDAARLYLVDHSDSLEVARCLAFYRTVTLLQIAICLAYIAYSIPLLRDRVCQLFHHRPGVLAYESHWGYVKCNDGYMLPPIELSWKLLKHSHLPFGLKLINTVLLLGVWTFGAKSADYGWMGAIEALCDMQNIEASLSAEKGGGANG